ncbi:CvpA family protein [Faecalicatena contorta]|uniref:CvpA family protein n=1 Tax=Faecalicatena contorta TaxID=39482 RepID=UPI001F316CC2|nr:CvpA family protein [Faecalicatena contorta]MCF2555697.1 CvpA family protein [Faecalicatena contorta]
MDWLLVVIGGIFLIGFGIGVYRGAIRIAVSLVTTIVTIIVVVFATPHVAKLISDKTPLDDMIISQVSKTMANAATSQVLDGDGDTANVSEEDVRKVLEAAGITEEQLAQYGISVSDIVNGNISGDELAQYGISSSLLDGLRNSGTVEKAIEEAEIPRDVQMAAIEKAELPEIFKELLSTNNNSEIYNELGAETFAQYVGRFLAKLIINIIAFLAVFILLTIVLRAVIFALDVVSNLPVLGFVNRLAGGGAGLLCALVVVWVLFIIITLLYTTSFGKEMYDVILGNDITKMIYENNPIMKLAVNFK